MTDEMAGEGAAEPPKKKSGLVRMLLFVGLPIILLIGGAGAGLYFSGYLDSMLGVKPAGGADAKASKEPKEAVFLDLPDLLVNLNTPASKKTTCIKIVVSLQLESKEDEPKIVAIQPRIVDTFQTYLRELRPEDLRGSAGLYRLREELLLRVSAAAAPVKIDDVLFSQMLVQN